VDHLLELGVGEDAVRDRHARADDGASHYWITPASPRSPSHPGRGEGDAPTLSWRRWVLSSRRRFLVAGGGEGPLLLVVDLGHLVADLDRQVGRGELDGAADGVLHGAGVRAAVADEAAAVDPEEGRGAVLAVVGAGADGVEGGLGEEVAGLGARVPPQLLAEHAAEELGERLGALQQHVADEAVADDDVRLAVEDVPP